MSPAVWVGLFEDMEVIAFFCELVPPAVYALLPNYPVTIYNLGPFLVNVAATDNSGIGTVTLHYS